jgi:hypothetical protein
VGHDELWDTVEALRVELRDVKRRLRRLEDGHAAGTITGERAKWPFELETKDLVW